MNLFKTSVLFCLVSFLSFGQATNSVELQLEIPTDPSVKIGELENGLTYYIKNNPKAKDKAELRLVINAGSVLEEEHQQGLAHFLEHMAFNGTRNFEKNELIDYLENLGVSFGADLNAHTGFDETVYKLSLPTDEETFNTGMQILRDWADGITLSHSEIDLERGVVAEELRGGRHVGRRMFESYIPVITNDSRHSKRFPIGLEEVVLNSEYSAIKDFYNDWYRPDLMAVIIVGDVEIAETEAKIAEVFGSLKKRKDARERVNYGIPDNEETTVAVVTDEEATDVKLQVYYKQKAKDVELLEDYREILVNRLYSGMLNSRMVEKIEKGNAAFLQGGVFIGWFLADKNSYYISGSLKEDAIEEGIESILDEHERARRMGFTQAELDRYKKSLLNSADLARKEEGKRNSKLYVEDYIDHFMNQEPIPGAEFTYEFYAEHLPHINLEEVNAVPEKWIKEDNISIVLAAPEKEGLEIPAEEELLGLLENSTKRELEPYVDTYEERALMEVLPTPGKVVSSEYSEAINTTTLKLSNGIKVVLKPTTLQNEIVSMSGFRWGGSSLAPDEIYVSARTASELVNSSGLNGLSATELRKVNTGKSVSVKPSINFYEELMNGSSATKDLETMFQLTHLFFTAPNKDENAFAAFKQRMIENSKNPEANPSRFFYNDIYSVMSQNHLRAVPISSETYEAELDQEIALDFYKKRFASADNFTFIFVGNFEVEEIKPLLERYLASLPVKNEGKDQWRDIGLRHPKGKIKKEYHRGKEDKAEVVLHFTGEIDFDLEKKELLSALASVVKLRLYDELREKRGGVYGVRVQGFTTEAPYEWYRLGIEFTGDPAKVEELIAATLDQIELLKKDGVTEEEVQKVKEALRLNVKEGLTYNNYWVGKLKEAIKYGKDPEDILNYEEKINRITAKDLQKTARKYFNPDNFAQFILYPEQK